MMIQNDKGYVIYAYTVDFYFLIIIIYQIKEQNQPVRQYMIEWPDDDPISHNTMKTIKKDNKTQ